jgi:hypothetical protein
MSQACDGDGGCEGLAGSAVSTVYVTHWPAGTNLSFAAKHVVRACPTRPATSQNPILGLVTTLAYGASSLLPGCFGANELAGTLCRKAPYEYRWTTKVATSLYTLKLPHNTANHKKYIPLNLFVVMVLTKHLTIRCNITHVWLTQRRCLGIDKKM